MITIKKNPETVGKLKVGTSASTDTLSGFSDSQAAIVGGDNVGLALQSTNSNKSSRVRFFDHSGNQDATVGFDNSNSNLFLGTGTAAHLTINTSGNMTTASDGIALKLDGSSNTTRGIFIRNTGGSAHGYLHTDGNLKIIAEDSGKSINFYTADDGTGTARLTIGSDGLATFSNGINLGDTTLSNYKEGTWTPVLAISGGNDGGTLTQTAGALGKYVRIGKMVHVMGIINVTAASGLSGATTIVQVNGFPFAADVNETYYYQYRFNFSREDAITSRKAENFISFYSTGTIGFIYDSGLGTGITGNELTTGKLVFSGSYITT